MIYFLVNNNYQYLEAVRLAGELRAAGRRAALIAIPHTLTQEFDPLLFDPMITLPTPAHLPWKRAWFQYLGGRRRLKAALSVNAEDTLLLFTEYELLNQLVAITFKERAASVFLLEDGGVGSYIPLTLKQSQPYTWKNRVLQVSMRVIPGLSRTRFTKFDGILFPMLDDRYLDGVYLYRGMAITRRIPVSILARPTLPPVKTQPGRVVFLNQPLYSEYIQTEADYASGLTQILRALCKGFSEVLFKFHPREPETAREQIRKQILDSFPTLHVVEGNQPFEAMLAELCPEVVASYNSTPLLNLSGTGVQPLFVYHLLPDLRNAESFDAMHVLLEAWGYQFAADWSELASGYHAGESFDDVSGATPLVQLLGPRMSQDGSGPTSQGTVLRGSEPNALPRRVPTMFQRFLITALLRLNADRISDKWFSLMAKVRLERLRHHGVHLNFVPQGGHFFEIAGDPKKFSIDDTSHLKSDTFIECSGGVSIGRYFHSGRGLTIFSSTHNYATGARIPYDSMPIALPVKIEDFVWCGANVTIMPGVSVGEG
ncbi:polysialyltransferase family glycosyltransferase, partial [Chromobacterium alticapitis]|uniref:polysialyltransferase family glycosyltransferase n=1 Tax=Chromobacterium alticapitis TaxID=2073169 RepID=UPI0018ED8FBA